MTLMLSSDELDARLVDGNRLLVMEDPATGTTRFLVSNREEEVPMALFTDYRERRLIDRIGNTNVTRVDRRGCPTKDIHKCERWPVAYVLTLTSARGPLGSQVRLSPMPICKTCGLPAGPAGRQKVQLVRITHPWR